MKKAWDDEFNLDIADKEFIVLVGPSGCGKSTTLRMIAGLEEITEGELFIGDRLVNDVAPKDRDIAMVFQNYALYPHLTVRQNITFPLENRKGKDKLTKEQMAGKALAIAKLVQIDENYNPTSVVNDFSAEFRFTMNIGAALPESSAAPEATLPPAEDSQPKEEEIPGYELPALPEPQRPPTPPAHLVTPANARKI